MKELLDIRDLRLYNLVLYKGELRYVSMLSLDIDDEYQDLIGVTPYGKTYGEKSDWIRAFGYDLTGVPTSDELLLKFGFTKDKDYDFGISLNKVPLYTKDDFNIMLSDGEYWYTTKQYDGGSSESFEAVTEVPFIHQIQNLYFDLNNKHLKLTL
jgi:hypothetical protein